MPEISMAAIWIASIIVLLIIEGATSGLVTIWFAIGAVAALLAELIGAPIWLQAVVFLVVSFVTLVFTRPLAQRHLNNKTQPTNADRVHRHRDDRQHRRNRRRVCRRTDVDGARGI